MTQHFFRSEIATRLCAGTLLAVLGLVALSGATTSPDTFNVELVVFRYNGTMASPENWDAPPPPDTPNPDVAAPAAAANATPEPYRVLTPAQFQLAGTESALRRNSSYEPIAHFGYRITTTEPDTGTAVRVQSLADAASGLSGTVTLQRGRFLHLALDLTYTTVNPPVKLLATNAAPGALAFRMRQDRRMRPYERHYFDHPAFGVLAIITPVGGSAD